MTIITTQNGTELELRPVSEFLITAVRQRAIAEFEKKHGGLPAKPTYTIVCGGGLFDTWEETHVHTAETIERGTDEEKALWKVYAKQQTELNGAIWSDTSHVYLLEGVPDPPDNSWKAKQEKYNVDIPDNQDERKLHWIKTEVIVSQNELSWLAYLIQGQSSFTEAGRQLAADTFRRAMEFAGRIDAITNSGAIS